MDGDRGMEVRAGPRNVHTLSKRASSICCLEKKEGALGLGWWIRGVVSPKVAQFSMLQESADCVFH